MADENEPEKRTAIEGNIFISSGSFGEASRVLNCEDREACLEKILEMLFDIKTSNMVAKTGSCVQRACEVEVYFTDCAIPSVTYKLKYALSKQEIIDLKIRINKYLPQFKKSEPVDKLRVTLNGHYGHNASNIDFVKMKENIQLWIKYAMPAYLAMQKNYRA